MSIDEHCDYPVPAGLCEVLDVVIHLECIVLVPNPVLDLYQGGALSIRDHFGCRVLLVFRVETFLKELIDIRNCEVSRA